MIRQSHLLVAAVTALLFVSTRSSEAQHSAAGTDDAFDYFWAASSPEEASQRVGRVLATGVDFDTALARLRRGRSYHSARAGIIHLSNRTHDGIEHNFAFDIPPSYDPTRSYQVRVQLHGGVASRSDNRPRNDGSIGALAGTEQIYVIPYAWDAQPWWTDDQILNLDAILDTLRRSYNVDENRVVLSGVSDGATGAYYVAMRDTTPFASFLPLNGFIMVLSAQPSAEGHLFPGNLLNKPLFVVNGGKDPLYPASTVEPYTRHLLDAGVQIEYHPQPEGEHNTRWWPQVKDTFEAFVNSHPREPHPAKLTWESDSLSGNRAHWLLIDRLGDVPGQIANLRELNAMKGVNNEGVMFLHPIPSGRVDLFRTGNTIEAHTRGVSAFTVLLSGDVFDLTQRVRLIANDRTIFDGRVTPDVRTLLKWSALDNDRTMLYAAELKVDLTCHPATGRPNGCVSIFH